MFDLLVFIGRFQPFHNEHKRIIETALAQSKHVLVLIGSAGSARNIRNPFTYHERGEMITYSFPEESGKFGWSEYKSPELIVKPLHDMLYNDTAWKKQVQDLVKETTLDVINQGQSNRIFRPNGTANAKVGIIGASKDPHTGFYLKMFPQFESVAVPMDNMMHASDIRRDYFNGVPINKFIPKSTKDFLLADLNNEVYCGFELTKQYSQLVAEQEHVKAYKTQWAQAPYPVKHVTVDALVEQSGHILVVKRRSEPGKGLFALPGGHLNEDETILHGQLRELKEETRLKVPDAVLQGSIVAQHVFDDPHRSNIGRVITHCAHIRLADATELPKVKGSDDAEKAFWMPLADVKECDFFDDHYHIIQYFLGAY